MALIVEDGSIVENANSYFARADLIAYAMLRGVVIADADASDVFAIKAMDYLETFRGQFSGQEVEPGVQPLAWPREGVCVGFVAYPSNAIPSNIVKAQLALALLSSQGIDFMPTSGAGASSEGFITREKIGPMETEYSEAIELAKGITPVMPQISALLAPFLTGGAGPTRSYRV